MNKAEYITNSKHQAIDCDAPVTIVVRRRPKPGKELEFEEYLSGISQFAAKQTGHLGSNIFRPDKAGDEYRTIFKFDSMRHYYQWENSQDRQSWREQASEVTEGEVYREIVSGLETWFTLPGEKSVVPPPKHKMSIVIWLSIFPIISLLSILLGPLIKDAPLLVRTASLTLVAVPLMTYVAMPRMTKLFHKWLHNN